MLFIFFWKSSTEAQCDGIMHANNFPIDKNVTSTQISEFQATKASFKTQYFGLEFRKPRFRPIFKFSCHWGYQGFKGNLSPPFFSNLIPIQYSRKTVF